MSAGIKLSRVIISGGIGVPPGERQFGGGTGSQDFEIEKHGDEIHFAPKKPGPGLLAFRMHLSKIDYWVPDTGAATAPSLCQCGKDAGHAGAHRKQPTNGEIAP